MACCRHPSVAAAPGAPSWGTIAGTSSPATASPATPSSSTPDAAWVTQQARQFSWHLQDREPGTVRFLLHDRDGKFAARFDTVVASEGIEVIKIPARAPNANAVAERVVRTIRGECLDQLLILNRRHLLVMLRQYLAYDNRRRPHQGLG
jgi:transposase InsO family protein